MVKTEIIGGWNLAYLQNKIVESETFAPKTSAEVKARLKSIKAEVPGHLELDLMREKLLPDLYYGTNALLAQDLENLHVYYYAGFDYSKSDDSDDFLVFEGIDTIAEIFLDGKKIGETENMLHFHEFSLRGLESGTHEVLVHVLPTAIYARKFDLPAMCFGLPYNCDSLEIRKAPYSFGWDIMPRIISCGIWKPVKIEKRPLSRIENPFTYTEKIVNGTATLKTALRVLSNEDKISDFYLQIEVLSDSQVCAKKTQRCFSANQRVDIELPNAKLWYPKNYGEPNLYTVKIKLLRGDLVADETKYRIGVRTVKLLRTSCAGENGEFCFLINGQKVFCLGTNYVPTDAFASRQKDYDLRALELAKEVGCNMIRCWGGNIYPSQKVYDFCDENGIMVWQDFAFGCGHYPDDERLCRLTRKEVKRVAIAYRNHPSLVLWAGDNECDVFVCSNWEKSHEDEGAAGFIDPNKNVLTRGVILQELRNHDATRPYLPSSPYLDELAYRNGLPAEDHLWGPRDYFKGEFYQSRICHFASETGYHGCNSPESLKKFLPQESLSEYGTAKKCENHDWIVHAAGMETASSEEGNPYAYRIPLMVSQVERIFTERKKDVAEFSKQSQISQAEADKFFIERFRMQKWRKTGIIWWNIIDGWPQISDAVVDWYGVKKLAFHYIKRSQSPFCMMIDEPKEGKMSLFAVNDTQQKIEGTYVVKDLSSGEVVTNGTLSVDKNAAVVISSLPEKSHAFYLIEWKTALGSGVNHHAFSLGDKWKYEDYLERMKKAEFIGEFSGF